MSEFKRICVAQAKTLMDAGNITLADIRDEASFKHSRLAGAVSLNSTNLQQFIESTDLDKPLIIYCYHGNSSQSAAQFLSEKGFEDIYSMDGGFEMWRQQFPVET